MEKLEFDETTSEQISEDFNSDFSVLGIVHWLHCTPKLKDTAVYIQDRLEMKLGPSKPLFHSYLIAKGTKKRDAPSAVRKGGRMSSCNTKSGIRTGTKQDKPIRTSTKIKGVSCSCGQLCKNFRGLNLQEIKAKCQASEINSQVLIKDVLCC